MSDRVRQYFSALSIILFLSGFAFADVGHSHYVPSGLHATPSLQSHDCNEQEQHKPLEVRFHCVQSCRILSLSYELAVDAFRPNVTLEYISIDDAPADNNSPLLLSESKRGPPVLNSLS